MSSHYADSWEVQLRVKSINANLDDDLLEDGLIAADDIINSTVPGAPFTDTIPEQITRAAIYYAAMDIIDILFTNNANRNPIATNYETRAQKILAPFM